MSEALAPGFVQLAVACMQPESMTASRSAKNERPRLWLCSGYPLMCNVGQMSVWPSMQSRQSKKILNSGKRPIVIEPLDL